jgi:reverse gyrase
LRKGEILFYQETMFWGLRKICKRRLWKRASFSIGAPLGNMEGGGPLLATLRKCEILFYQTMFWGLQEICKRRLWKRASLSIGAPLGNMEGRGAPLLATLRKGEILFYQETMFWGLW